MTAAAAAAGAGDGRAATLIPSTSEVTFFVPNPGCFADCSVGSGVAAPARQQFAPLFP